MSENKFMGYEYQDVTMKRDMKAIYIDEYENFGWKVEQQIGDYGDPTNITLRFKRDRKTKNQTQLTKIGKTFNSSMQNAMGLKKTRHSEVSILIYLMGLIEIVLMACSVFLCVKGMILPSVILAAVALVSWIIPYEALGEKFA